MKFSNTLENLLNNKHLSYQEAEELMNETMSGNLSSAQIAAWLIAIRSKKESSDEIAAFSQIMRDKAVEVKNLDYPVIDTCGTGGDKSNLINISTLASIVLAAMGYKIAKHGNRSMSSSFGSADLLEALGYPLNESSEEISNRINKNNFGFMFAPNFHPAMKHAIGARKDLGVRTVFNILGPLSNPAKANIHLLGVFTKDLVSTMTKSLQKLKVDTALVVSSEDNLDEISPIEKTYYNLLVNNTIQEGYIDPTKINLSIKNLNNIKALTKEEALEKAKNILNGTFLEGIEAVALNVTSAMFLWDVQTHKNKLSLEDYISSKISSTIEFIQSKKALKFVENGFL